MKPSPIVQAHNLSRFYGVVLGLNNVSFEIHPGITGLVGPNGAGKTTLFRLFTGQIRPSHGEITVFGGHPWNNPAVPAPRGEFPEREAGPAGLRPLDWLSGLGMISGLSARDAERRSREALDRVRLASAHWGKPVNTYSKGMRQRVKLAQCLLHAPELIILDEPMNGLDPMGREDFSGVLRQLAREGVSVLLSSHILHDLDALCGDFILLRWGRIPRESRDAVSPEARQRRPDATTIRCDAPEKLARYLFDQDLLRGFEFGAEADILHARWRDADAFHARFAEHLLASGVRIFEVRHSSGFLEKIVGAGPTHSS